ncbi:hypothetical protein [Ralstonia chuxiongensis]|uniref:hypothetical protein n=1 Tax=Ralstonia chuxiongensis TaxID=2957504 RepID=UPI0028F62CD4|nr:hypothetical protein [Ralstonia chuxiongensis]CAJ0773004.1 hypothetical protein R8510_03192 [Ralstonia chuxiongensis]
MKPFRQIDVANTMTSLGKCCIKFAVAMLETTASDQLVARRWKTPVQNAPTEVIQRLERELAAHQPDTCLLEDNYGPENLLSQYLAVTPELAHQLQGRDAGLRFDWAPDSSSYVATVEERPPQAMRSKLKPGLDTPQPAFE